MKSTAQEKCWAQIRDHLGGSLAGLARIASNMMRNAETKVLIKWACQPYSPDRTEELFYEDVLKELQPVLKELKDGS